MKRLFLLIALFMLLVPAFATKVAILIGCNAYLSFSPLKCCVADVNTMRDALKAAGYQVYTMTGKEVDVKGEPIYAFAPLKKNIDHQLDVWVPEKAYGAGDTLLFFFSGHGIRSLDGLDYLAPLDGQFKGDAVDFTSLVPMHTLYEQLRRSGAENLFIITDACRNEPGRGVVKSGGFGQGAARDLTELKVNDQQHVMLLRSCTEEQRSYEMPDGAGGYFTHAFSLGLAGAAAQDGAVTAAGLCEFVKEQVRKEVAAAENLPQVPQFTFTNADPTTIILAEKPAELHFSLTTPAALARGEELLLDSDSVIVEGVVDDAPGVALSVDGEREVTLRAASKDLVTKITRRPFTVTLTGFRPGNSYRKVLTLHDAAGHRTQVTLRLRYPGTALGNLHVTTDPPGAQVMVGGGTVDGVTPLTVKGLPAGDITVLVTRDGFGDVTQTVKILPGQEAPLVVKLPLLQGAIVVKSNPPGATVFIDNVERGVTIMEGLKVIAIPIGTHTIKLTLPDYREETCQELVTNHGNKEVSVPLTGLPGKVTITTTPKGATVTLDGQERGKSLLSLTDIPAGQHEARVSLMGYAAASQKFSLPPNGSQLVTFELIPLEKAQLEVTSDPPGATVYINGFERGSKTPAVITMEEIGEEAKEIKVEAKLVGYTTAAEMVTLKAGVQHASKFRLRKGGMPGEITINPKDGAQMVFIPAGAFLMGSMSKDKFADLAEKPQHTVNLDGYYIYKNDVTVAQYSKFCQTTGRPMPVAPAWGWQDNHPVVNVTWDDAYAYAVWAGVSLPTEAQWEKAARGTDGRIYPWGNIWDIAKGQFAKSSTAPVGSFPAGASPYGVMDMAGNVWQWCNDWYDNQYYRNSPASNPTGPATGIERVMRGGSWGFRYLNGLRSEKRAMNFSSYCDEYDGFRCACGENMALSRPTTDLTLDITAPETLKSGEELLIEDNRLTVTGYVSDEEGVQLLHHGETIPLGEPSKEAKPVRRFSLTLADIQSGSRLAEELELRDAFGRSVKKTLKIRCKSKEPVAGEERINPKDGVEMIYIPAGEFLMGSKVGIGDSDEKPQHTVYLDGYFMYKHDVTVAQYQKFCQATGRMMPDTPDWGWLGDHPIVNVSWESAKAYADWAGASLPTEAQWEKAARGTDGRFFPWGNTWDYRKCANADRQNYGKTSPVGSYPTGISPAGLSDMAGNVFQWCADWYAIDYYQHSPDKNPTGPNTGTKRVLRGGSWNTGKPLNFRTAFRSEFDPKLGNYDTGFRCVCRADIPVANVATNLTFVITAPDALARGEELVTTDTEVTITGYVSDMPGIKILHGGKAITLGERCSDHDAMRSFSLKIIGFKLGNSYVEELEASNGALRRVKKTFRIKCGERNDEQLIR